MKKLIFSLICGLSTACLAQTVPDGFVVNQVTAEMPVAIYSVTDLTIVSKTTEGPFKSEVLRLFVNVTAEGNLCNAKGLVLQAALINPARSIFDYELSLQKIRPLSINEQTVGCTLGGIIVHVHLPLVIDSGGPNWPYSANYYVRTTTPFSPATKIVLIHLWKNGTDWKTSVTEVPQMPLR